VGLVLGLDCLIEFFVNGVYPGTLLVFADGMQRMNAQTRIELEAAAFRRLLAHLRERNDVQNIDLMELAGFCRNCLANWYQDAAEAEGLSLSKDEAREIIYGMPYETWKAMFQKGPQKPTEHSG
jgi:hypothetical protein